MYVNKWTMSAIIAHEIIVIFCPVLLGPLWVIVQSFEKKIVSKTGLLGLKVNPSFVMQ